MPFVDVYSERRTEAVMRDTWGHLDAEVGVRYPGVAVFAIGEYGGERIILSAEFGAAGYGPWFYEGINDWLFERDLEDGSVYRFVGWYRLCKNGRHQFVGKIRRVDIPPA